MKYVLLFTFSFFILFTHAQMVTGVWHGKVGRQNAEVKIIKNGDSITGTSYYYTSANNYRRYSIKGYVDEATNQVVWWDDQLLNEKSGGILGAPGKIPLVSRADFNCPGGVMKLDGSTVEKDKQTGDGQVHLEKISSVPTFTDEWDYVIDNYTTGTNNPDIIDSVSRIPFTTKTVAVTFPKADPKPGTTSVVSREPEKKKVMNPEPPKPMAIPAQSIEQKFTSRTKKVFTTIPVEGDSISLSFYDNAIVDGDSISLFLDERMLFTHLRLSEKPHTIKLALNELTNGSELTMVAENLGTIPPNTSYMVAMVGDKRYTANLTSTEESSAVIKLTKQGR